MTTRESGGQLVAGDAMNSKGFTLIELLVTISVMVILATVAVPGFQGMMESNRIVSDHNEILAGVNYARSEAVKRRQSVTVEVDGGVSGVWSVEVSHEDDDGNKVVLMTREARDDRVSVSGNSVIFNALGRRGNCILISDECVVSVEGRDIVIGPAGRIERGGGGS